MIDPGIRSLFNDFVPVPAKEPGEFFVEPPPPYELPKRLIVAYRKRKLSSGDIAELVHRPVKQVRQAIKRQLGFLYPAGRQSRFDIKMIPTRYVQAYRRRLMSSVQIAKQLSGQGRKVTPGMVLRALRAAGEPIGKKRPLL